MTTVSLNRWRNVLVIVVDASCVVISFVLLFLTMGALGLINSGLGMVPPVAGEDAVLQPDVGSAFVPIACLVVAAAWTLLGIAQRPCPGQLWSVRHLCAAFLMMLGWLIGEWIYLGMFTFSPLCSEGSCETTPFPVVMAIVGVPVLGASVVAVAVARSRHDALRWVSCLPGVMLALGLVIQHALWRPDLFAS